MLARATGIAVAAGLAALLALSAPASAAAPLPAGWPHRLHLGLTDSPGGAAALRRSVPLGFRYQYLAAGANTGDGWATWNPDGSFVTRYVQESRRITPVFTYYMVRQSLPGRDDPDERRAVLGNLRNPQTMRALLEDARLLFQRAGATGRRVVVHVEPDLWGYGHQVARGDDAATVPAAVASSGVAEAAGLPDDLAGLAQAFVRLRDRHAPRVVLGWHLSVWGTQVDVALQDPPNSQVDALATRAAAFYRSLNAGFDLTFAEFDDRDSGFNERVLGDGGRSWWTAADFRRNVRFLGRFSRLAGQRLAMWQIPLGNRRMRAVDDTWGHYRDNRVERLLGDRRRRLLRSYRRAGVVAFLFGGGAEGTTCACDARRDGVTNPPPSGRNRRRSYSADDDGGLFRVLARRYYRRGPLRLR